jgi:cytoskeletal protein RodZ
MALPAKEKFLLILYVILFLSTFTIIYLAVNRDQSQQLTKLEFPNNNDTEKSIIEINCKETDGQKLSKKIAEQKTERDLMGDEIYQNFLYQDSKDPIHSQNPIGKSNSGEILEEKSSKDSQSGDSEYYSLNEESSDYISAS